MHDVYRSEDIERRAKRGEGGVIAAGPPLGQGICNSEACGNVLTPPTPLITEVPVSEAVELINCMAKLCTCSVFGCGEIMMLVTFAP